jgi:hypothetical protein
VIALNGRTISNESGKTNELGRAYVRFKLPADLNTNDGLLNIVFQYKGMSESISRSIPITLGKIDLAFYPEGGDLLADHPCGLGFKALNEFGKPADVKGEILDSKGQVVATFNSYHQGMGSLIFTPKAGEQYSARITQPSNAKGSFNLPQAKLQGQSLQVEQGQEQLRVKVQSSQPEELFVVVHSRGKMHYSNVLPAEKGNNQLYIPTEQLPIGICQVTVFNSQKVPVAERLVFANAQKQLNISISTDKEKYLPREEVKMDISVKDENNKPVSGNFSLAVVDDKLLSFADDKQGHLLSYMLLESDLKGEIVEPNFYFDNPRDPKRPKPEVNRSLALDQLLLSQGWRRFTWTAVQQQSFLSLPIIEKAALKGMVLREDGKPFGGAKVEILGKSTGQLTNSKGEFEFKDWLLYEPIELLVSAPGMVPQKMVLNEYNGNISVQLSDKKAVKGRITFQQSWGVQGYQIFAGNTLLGTAGYNGEYLVKVPMGTKSLTFKYPNNRYYETKTINLKDQYDEELNVSVAYSAEYQREMQQRRTASARAKGAGPGAKRAAVPQVDEAGGFVQGDAMFENVAVAPMPAPPAVQEAKAEMAVRATEAQKKEAAKSADKAKAAPAKVDLPREDIVLEEADQELVMDLRKEEPAAKKPVVPIEQPAPKVRYYRHREFYAPKYTSTSFRQERTDFRNTIYWNPNVVVKEGKASLRFHNSDALTQFAVTIEGFGQEGQIGRTVFKYFTQKPFEILAKVPAEVLTGDKLLLPITLTNNSAETVNGQLQIELPSHLKWLETPPQSLSLAANQSKTIWLSLEVLNKIEKGDLSLRFKDGAAFDKVAVLVNARPRGFPVRQVYSGSRLSHSFAVDVEHPIDGSMRASLHVYASAVDEVIGGLESMLRMPSGCFEQTSSSNYPNVLVLNYLRSTQQNRPDLEKTIQGYLETGYQRLTGYESKSGGFHWWGYDPAHEALTAYGLLQFVDMSKVYKVDPKMLERTAQWLLNRRDGKGGWNLNPNALHSWGTSDLTHAYIVWALSEAGHGGQIGKELEKSLSDAQKSEDPYLLGLLANALLANKDARAETLISGLANKAQKEGYFKGKTTSVVNSSGKTLDIETTGLVATALMKSKNSSNYRKTIEEAVTWLKGQKDYYGYGSTLGTVAALKTFLQFAEYSKVAKESGDLALYVDGQKMTSLHYEAGQKEIKLEGVEKYLRYSKQVVELRFEKTQTPLPFELKLSYSTSLPRNAKDCALNLSTQFAQKSAKVGETVRMNAIVKNTSKNGVPMTMAMIGIPAGLSLQPWQLKELQERRVFDYYELFDGYLVLHYEQLKPEEERSVALDLKADIAGQYEAPASCAFLYYTQEKRFWVKPDAFDIKAN